MSVRGALIKKTRKRKSPCIILQRSCKAPVARAGRVISSLKHRLGPRPAVTSGDLSTGHTLSLDN